MNNRLQNACAPHDAKRLFWTDKDGGRYGREPKLDAVVDVMR
ncbi:MAG: hypothetical protein V3U65_08835 [Granulosicoccaceae bacterium]